MAGYATDSSTLVLSVELPAGTLRVVGENDGVNGFEWTATINGLTLPVEVEHHVLIDGITDPEDDE